MQDDELKPGVAYTPKPAEPHTADQNAPVTPQQAPQAPQQPFASNTPPQGFDTPNQPLDAPEDYEDEQVDPTSETTLMSWNAPEFTFTNKPSGWYLLLGLFFLALIGLAIYTEQYFTIALLVLMNIALVIYARRKPRTLNYTLTTHGVHVGDKAYAFDSFSSFYEISDYGQRVIELVPARQFGTLVSLPVEDDQENTVEELLGNVLPKVPARNDMIDRLLRTLRF
jgi:hypothetical protein